MASKHKGRKAWLVSWDWFTEGRKVDRNHVYFLPPHKSSDQVKEFLKGLYMNSSLFLLEERTRFLRGGKQWEGYVHEGDGWILVGDNPFLEARLVSELRFETDYKRNIETIHWVNPPKWEFNRKAGKYEVRLPAHPDTWSQSFYGE